MFEIGKLYKITAGRLSFGNFDLYKQKGSDIGDVTLNKNDIVLYLGTEEGVWGRPIFIFLYDNKRIYRYKDTTYPNSWFKRLKC